MEKENKRLKGKQRFKTWLKESLVQQRQVIYHKAQEKHTKTLEEEDLKKNKDNMKVMAKIAFKEWKERKADEAREKKEMSKKIKRAERLEQQEIRMARRQLVAEMQRRRASGRPGGGG